MKRFMLIIAALAVLSIGFVLSASAGHLIEFDQPAQTQTAVYGTIDAIVVERFAATATQQAIIDAAATSIAQKEIAPTLTAAFEETVDARFYAAVTGTAQVVLQTGTPTPIPPQIDALLTQSSAAIVTVNTGAVPTLRTCAARTCDAIRNLSSGEYLNVISVQGAWIEVETLAGERGFIPSSAVDTSTASLPTSLPSPTPTITLTPTVTPTSDISRLTSPKGDGTYRVGTEIAIGRWESLGGGLNCYWARKDSDGEINDNHFGSAGGTVFITDADYEVEFSRCGLFTYVEGLERRLEGTAHYEKIDGFYTVGVEITTGNWRTPVGRTGCYWALIDETGEIIDNYYGDSGGLVRVTSNVYEVQFENCGFVNLETASTPSPRSSGETLNPGVPYEGNLRAVPDEFLLQFEQGVAYVVSLNSADFDPYLQIRDANGEVVIFDDDSGTGNNARLLFAVPETAEYTLVASSYNDSGSGAYNLTLVPQTGELALGEALQIQVDGATSLLYSIDLVSGEYTFGVESGGRLNETVDTSLILFDEEGTELAFADDTDGLNPVIEGLRIPARGTYYILLAPYNENAVGEVALLVEQE